MQVFLRLVRPGHGAAESRRRVTLAELTDIGVDPVVLSQVLTTFGHGRLITFDRDPASGRATVEVAHEALLVEWERLAGWIERHRAELRGHAALMAAAEEWESSGRNPDYLFAGSRLAEYEPLLSGGVVQLSGRERGFLLAAVERRRVDEAAALARQDGLHRREHKERMRVVAMGGAIFILAAVLVYALVVGLGGRAPTIALVTSGVVYDEFTDTAFDQAIAEFGLVGVKARVGEADIAAELRRLSEAGAALVIVSPAYFPVDIASEFPDVQYLNLNDAPVDEPNRLERRIPCLGGCVPGGRRRGADHGDRHDRHGRRRGHGPDLVVRRRLPGRRSRRRSGDRDRDRVPGGSRRRRPVHVRRLR
jgi:hypothetical protein